MTNPIQYDIYCVYACHAAHVDHFTCSASDYRPALQIHCTCSSCKTTPSGNRPWQFLSYLLCVRSLNKQQTCFETTVAHNVFSSTQDFPYLGMQVVHTPLLFQIGHIALKFSGDGHYQLLADVVAFTRKFAYILSCPIACSS